jgi:O-acetyl-ADP-ribose deacetylase (regulator of RNase III)
MLTFKKGNILESGADALVNTVNTQGVMGKGIALQFRKEFPHNYKIYEDACKKGELQPGKLLIVEDQNLLGGKVWIINFPTKTSWRKPSEYIYIEQGLNELVRRLPDLHINTIALPPLGSGNGGLDWSRVKEMISSRLSSLSEQVIVYEPTALIAEKMKKERVQLTEARAMLLYMLYQLQKAGEFVSEFSCEKICYFLQRFGGQPYFRLEFRQNFYGPYSGKVRHVINYLNGSYIMGYSSMDKKPFEALQLIPDGEKIVTNYLDERPELKKITSSTQKFLDGFYSDFALELLSSIDYITIKENSFEFNHVKSSLEEWSERKRTMFANDRFIFIALDHLKNAKFPAYL